MVEMLMSYGQLTIGIPLVQPTPVSSTKTLKGLNAVGNTSILLYPDQAANEVYDGDLIELGFFKLSDGTASDVAFKGDMDTTYYHDNNRP